MRTTAAFTKSAATSAGAWRKRVRSLMVRGASVSLKSPALTQITGEGKELNSWTIRYVCLYYRSCPRSRLLEILLPRTLCNDCAALSPRMYTLDPRYVLIACTPLLPRCVSPNCPTLLPPLAPPVSYPSFPRRTISPADILLGPATTFTTTVTTPSLAITRRPSKYDNFRAYELRDQETPPTGDKSEVEILYATIEEWDPIVHSPDDPWDDPETEEVWIVGRDVMVMTM